MSSLKKTPGGYPPSGNLLLDSLSSDDYAELSPRLELHALSMRETLVEAGDIPDYAYFPVNGVISVLTVLQSGMMIEFATIGHEGTTGVPLFLGFDPTTTALISQIPGESLRLSNARFADAVTRLPTFRAMMLRYSGLLLTLVAQSAACNPAHRIEARCARWLLTTQDQAGADEFPITQEFLSQMLGASRPSVSLAAAELQRAGLLEYGRGRMRIVDRAGLERAACECYAVLRDNMDHFAASAREG